MVFRVTNPFYNASFRKLIGFRVSTKKSQVRVNVKICGNAYGEFAGVSAVIPMTDLDSPATEITLSLDWCR
jgi:hypothetical protein